MHFSEMRRIDTVAFFARILAVVSIILAFLTNNQHLEIAFWILAVIGVLATIISMFNSASKCLYDAQTFLTIFTYKLK